MKARDINMYLILGCMVVVVLWMFLIYAPLRKEKQFAETMIGRRENRIQTRAAVPELPQESKVRLQGNLETLTSRLSRLKQRLASYNQRFVSLETVDGIKSLRLEIASLAEWSGVNVRRFGVLNDSNEISDSTEAIADQIRPQFGRPVLGIDAEGEYAQLIAFLEKLDALEYNVAIVQFELIAPSYDDMIEGGPKASVLSMNLELAL